MHLAQKIFVIALALGSVRAAETPPAAPPPASPDLAQLLAYDASAPKITLVHEEISDGVVVRDLAYPATTDGAPAIQAYVVRPAGERAGLAAVLFVHWFAPPDPTSNRTQFLAEAKALARRGVVSLLPSTFWSDPARYRARKWETDFENSLAQARDLRRAFDVLLAEPGVDATRVAYVGHDYGGMFGMTVAAVDHRARASVFIAGTAHFPDWYLFGSSTGRPTGDDLKKFRDTFAVIDPVNTISRVQGAVFFQYGETDRYTPRKNFTEIYLAAPRPTRLATYPSDHDMSADNIHRDRTEWLSTQLSLKD